MYGAAGSMNTFTWNGETQSETVIVRELWEIYICSWPMKPDDTHYNTTYLQKMLMLQESIRRAMRESYDSYLHGKATHGVVSETRGHASLMGKIIKAYRREWSPCSEVEGMA